MKPHWKWIAAIAMLCVSTAAGNVYAVPLERCARLVNDPRGGRDTIVNICSACIAVKVERRRPGTGVGTPTHRDYLLPRGSKLTLPFRGPGKTRIIGEGSCPTAR